MKVKIKTDFVNDKMKLPKYAHVTDAGMDLQANLMSYRVLFPGDRTLVPTGLFVALPSEFNHTVKYEIQVRPRSGLSLNYGITVLNTPGTIDAGYRNEIGVLLFNAGKHAYTIEPGERIAQAVLGIAHIIEWEEVFDLPEADRQLNGFGSTGK